MQSYFIKQSVSLSKIFPVDILQSIEINPKIMMGKPVIKGTRITVELILEKLSCGETIEDILIAHPHITRENIQAALAFAARNLKADTFFPLAI
jgi:uncharacterized protein (DUF433 family)